MSTCFAIMPFGAEFNEINEVLRKAAQSCGLRYSRGDLNNKSGNIMPQVEHEIKTAAVIIAEISGHNANVFYELGMAHQLIGQERVVIISRSIDATKNFDIHQCRQLIYEPDAAGRRKLLKELPRRIMAALEVNPDRVLWNITRGRLPRTLNLTRDLQRVIDKAGSKGLRGLTIRVNANLSSLAISDDEPLDSKLGLEFSIALQAERDTVREALVRGARMKLVLNPARHFIQAQLPDRLSARYRRLIGLLEGRSDIRNDPESAAKDLKAIKRCKIVLSSVPMPNFFIVEKEFAYEGMKRSNAGGFDMTHCETGEAELADLVRDFDQLFEECREEMCRTHPPDGHLLEQLKAFYREATAGAKTGRRKLQKTK